MTLRRGGVWIRAALVLVCLGGLVWVVWRLGPRRVLAVAVEADPFWLALSVVPIAGRFAIWALKWCRMLAREASVPYLLAVRILGAGSFVNLTTPTAKLAGGIVRAALLRRRRGWRLATAYGYSMADQVTNVLGSLALFGLVALVAAPLVPSVEGRRALWFSGPAVLVGLGAVAALRGTGWRLIQRPDFQERVLGFVPRRFRASDATGDLAAERIRLIFFPLLGQGHALRTFVPDVLLAAAAFASVCAANALVLRALGAEAPLALVCVAVVLGYFAGVLVGFWGGVGVTEAALTGLYVQIGIPADLAAAGALLHRGIFYVTVLAWGGYALMKEGGTDEKAEPP